MLDQSVQLFMDAFVLHHLSVTYYSVKLFVVEKIRLAGTAMTMQDTFRRESVCNESESGCDFSRFRMLECVRSFSEREFCARTRLTTYRPRVCLWLRHCYYFRWQSFLYSAPIVDLSGEFPTAITSLMEPPRRDAGRLSPKSLIQDYSSGSRALRRRRRRRNLDPVVFAPPSS